MAIIFVLARPRRQGNPQVRRAPTLQYKLLMLALSGGDARRLPKPAVWLLFAFPLAAIQSFSPRQLKA